MRNIRCVNYLAWLVSASSTFLSVVAGDTATAQSRFALTASLEQEVTREGVLVYEFRVHVNPFVSPEAVVESLIAPDGTAGVEFFPQDSLSVRAENLLLPAALSAFSGAWTFTERRGSELLEYEFTLPEITPDLFPEAPEIVSPQHGDEVQSGFLLDWEYDSGAEFSGVSTSFRSFGVEDFERVMVDDTSAKIFFGLQDGTAQGTITARVGQSASQPLDIRPLSQGADATFELDFLSIKSRSTPITVTAVPEPTTFALLVLAASVSMTGRRGRTVAQNALFHNSLRSDFSK